jgi:hypothetical protein
VLPAFALREVVFGTHGTRGGTLRLLHIACAHGDSLHVR